MSQQGIRSLETGLGLFQHLHRLQRPASLMEIAKATSMTPSKAHRYVVSLIRAGMVRQSGRGLYQSDPACLDLGGVSEREKARQLAIEMLPALVGETGETAFISEWGHVGPVVVHVEEGPKPFCVRPTSRGDMPVHNSATGRAFAAYLDPAKLERIIDAELAALDGGKLSRTARAEQRRIFFRHLDDVHKRGLARTTGERFPGLNSFSAPVFGRAGDVVLAISCHGLAAMVPAAWNGAIPNALRRTAALLTDRIGGVPPRGRDRLRAREVKALF